jgi:hypothetical protein
MQMCIIDVLDIAALPPALMPHVFLPVAAADALRVHTAVAHQAPLRSLNRAAPPPHFFSSSELYVRMQHDGGHGPKSTERRQQTPTRRTQHLEEGTRTDTEEATLLDVGCRPRIRMAQIRGGRGGAVHGRWPERSASVVEAVFLVMACLAMSGPTRTCALQERKTVDGE